MSGWPGVCYDATDGNDSLTTKEVGTALAGATTSMDIVAFDAGLMGMTEVAYELTAKASVMVGSEQTVPGAGFPYDAILGDLVKNPVMTAAQLGQATVTRYGQSYTSGTPVSLSAIDLSKVQSLGDAVSSFGDAVMTGNTDWGVIYNSQMNAGF